MGSHKQSHAPQRVLGSYCETPWGLFTQLADSKGARHWCLRPYGGTYIGEVMIVLKKRAVLKWWLCIHCTFRHLVPWASPHSQNLPNCQHLQPLFLHYFLNIQIQYTIYLNIYHRIYKLIKQNLILIYKNI